jgi:hypothetical protein
MLMVLLVALAGATVVRRARPRLVAEPPRLGLPPADPAPLQLAPPRPTRIEVADGSGEPIITNRTKSGETVALASVPGWEADLRDRGHRKGFTIILRQSGRAEAVETLRADGALRADARELALDTLRRQVPAANDRWSVPDSGPTA